MILIADFWHQQRNLQWNNSQWQWTTVPFAHGIHTCTSCCYNNIIMMKFEKVSVFIDQHIIYILLCMSQPTHNLNPATTIVCVLGGGVLTQCHALCTIAYLSVDKVNVPILEEGQLKRECPISNVVMVVHLIPLNGKSLLCNKTSAIILLCHTKQ